MHCQLRPPDVMPFFGGLRSQLQTNPMPFH